MFKTLQVDPETSAIQINEYALTRHTDHALLPGLVTMFFGSAPMEVARVLLQDPDTDRQARLAGFASNLLHELRHYADILFTPYGFYRLRVAFEFYNAITILLGDEKTSTIPIPLISGVDPINRQLLGLDRYAGTTAERYSSIALSRMHIVAADNRAMPLANGKAFSAGGDSILEALAYATQSEWLLNVFNTPATRTRYPHFFSHYNGSAFDIKYRWFAPLRKAIAPGDNRSTAQLVQCILFASLCGAYARGAKYFVGKEGLPAVSTRFVDECLPSNRLNKLVRYFAESPPPATEDWQQLYLKVDEACGTIWGRSLTDEIGTDIEADQALLRMYEKASPGIGDRHLPLLAFRDLVQARSSLFKVFKKNPADFIDPVGFTHRIAPMLAPPVIWVNPKGLRDDEKPKGKDVRVIAEDRLFYGVQTGDEKKEVHEDICYSYWRPQKHKGRVDSTRHADAWDSVFSVLGPLYKGLLYGHKYRSMLEGDIVKALSLNLSQWEKLVWDPDYRQARDVTAPDEYFEFFGLHEADCDSCAKKVDRAGAFLVSSLTVKQNTPFVEHFTAQHGNFAALELLKKDWSVWLICREEAHAWGFVAH